MTFTQVQNGSAITGSTASGVTTLTLTLPVASTAGTLLVACIESGQAGVPAKISGVTISGGGTNPNTSPGWEWCCTSVNGSGGGGQQCEIWCYRKNPGSIASTTWTIASGQGMRGHMMEFSTTSAYQVMELFPGLSNSVQPGDTSFPVSMGNAVGSGELAIALFADNFSAGTANTWTTPAGWTAGRNTSGQSIQAHWASYWQTTAAAGAVSVTGTASTNTNQVGWEAAVVVFKETAAVRSRVGGSCSAGSYNDQSSYGLPATKAGSAAEADIFVGRRMFQNAQVSYQTPEGNHLSGTPSSDLSNLFAMGAQIIWSLKPYRTGMTGFTTVAAEQAAVDSDLTIVKQAGITGFICCLYNEMNLGGTNGPFGNDTNKNGPDPYGPNNTATTARNHWLNYWGNYQPVLAAHGIPAYTKPSFASPPSCVSWHPPAGTVSGVVADFYYGDSNGKNAYLDTSAGSDPIGGFTLPSLQDVCDGVKNPDNTTATNTPIPLGIGEWGRAGGSASTVPWATIAAWSHNGSNTGHVRDFFAARLTANKMNAPVLWFENNGPPTPGPNWLHVPGANGEDETAILAELAALVDAIGPQAPGTTVTVTTTTLPNGALGVAYSQALQVTGGSAPYTWALLTGSLPTGLSLSSAGVISGTPSAAGTFTFTVKATDSGANVGNSGTLSITVPGIAITTTSLPSASIGVPYSQTLTESGGTGPFTWSLSADSVLPAGITFSAAGVLSGTTGDVPGNYPLTVTVTDSLSNTATAGLTLTLAAGSTGGGQPGTPLFGYPQLIVEAGFYTASPVAQPGALILDDPVNGTLDTAILSDGTAWTDISVYARSGSIARTSTRVQGPLRTYQGGTGSVTLDGSDGRFDPLNLAGPYVTGTTSNIRAMIPVRVRALFGSVLYNLYQGFIDSWSEAPVDYDAGYSEVTASGSDGFKVLAGITLPAQAATGANEPTGNRIRRILDSAGWFTDHRSVDTGNSQLQATGYGDTVLNLLQLAADSEAGELYIDGRGFLTFRERQAPLEDTRSTTVQATFGDLPGYTVLTAQSQGFEGGIGTWTGAGNCAVSATGAAFYDGTGAMAMTSQASGNMTAAHCAAASILTQGLPVTPGQVIACSAYVLAAASARSAQAGAQFYDSTGTVVGSALYGGVFLNSTSAWTPVTASITTPAGAAYARLSILIQSTGGASEVHYVDDAALYYPELAYAAVSRADDDTTLANDVQATIAGGSNMQEAKNADSIIKYLFPRSYARSDILLQSDAEALTWAQWVLWLSLDGENRFDQLTIDPIADPFNLFPQVLGREIGDRIMIWRRPKSTGAVIGRACFIRGITHSIDVSAGTWSTTWDLQDAARYAGFAILDDPAYGRVSKGNLLAY